MSFLGSLERFRLSDILQRLETHAKTGVLIIQQGEKWVELYFRCGQLMCIGPVRSNVSLGDRLLQAGVISQQALQEAMLAIGPSAASDISETRMALTLIDLGHVDHDSLYAWAAKDAARVIRVLLSWTTGELYFEEELQPPPNRLLIALSITSLLPTSASIDSSCEPVPVARSAAANASAHRVQERSIPDMATPPPSISGPSISDASLQTFAGVSPMPASSLFSSEFASPVSDRIASSFSPSRPSLAEPMTTSIQPIRIDTPFMMPEMVLLPTDLSALSMQSIELQLTPEQWRLFTRADGHTSLQIACQVLAMSPGQVRQLAGELMALGLVTVCMPPAGFVNELSPASQEFMNSGFGNGYVAPGAAASPVEPWVAIMPTGEYMDRPPSYSRAPIETVSQWGNGGNGAKFVLGDGWVLSSSSFQTLQPGEPLYRTSGNNAPVEIGVGR